MKDFETPEEMLDFVLAKAGGMEYFDNLLHTTEPLYIEITKNFDTRRVFYAIELLQDLFNMSLYKLEISESISEIEEGYLDKTNIKYLVIDIVNLYRIDKLPKLPRSIEKVEFITMDDWYDLRIVSLGDLYVVEMKYEEEYPGGGQMHNDKKFESLNRDECLRFIEENGLQYEKDYRDNEE